VIVAALGVSGHLLTGSDRAITPPATHGSVSPTTENAAEAPIALPDQPLLRPADLGAVGPYTAWQQSPDAVSELVRPLDCVSSPSTWGANHVESAMYYDDLDAHVVEHVLEYPTAPVAAAATSRPWEEFTTCPSGDLVDATVMPRSVESVPGMGDAASRASLLTTPKADSEKGYYELAVARVSNIVVVLQWSSMGNPQPNNGWVWDADRVQAALDRASS
jgi:hypothetical protein